MQRFLIPLLLLISISLPNRTSAKENHREIDGADKSIKVLLSGNYSSALYKANIDIYRHNFSGLLLFKQSSERDVCSVVFLSEIGLTLLQLDYDILLDDFTVITCQSFMDRKKVIKALSKDMRMLVKQLSFKDQSKLMGKSSNSTIYDRGVKYFFNRERGEVLKTKRRYSLFFRSVIQATSYSSSVPKFIYINHKGVDLNIELKLIKEVPLL